MSAEIKKEIKLEIGHVLFMDIVGYSKLLINQQRTLRETLNEIVRQTETFREADSTGTLIKSPTGDGMALVFRGSVEEPVECALEVSRVLKAHPELPLRMGVHSGPVSGVVDVNDQTSVAGAGINMAQRVMDCGDAGHILLSKHVAEDLESYGHWQPHLHNLGECEVKHGVRVHLVNLCTEELGNPAPPEKFKQLRGKKKTSAAPIGKVATSRWPLAIAAILIAALLAVGSLTFWRRPSAKPVSNFLAAIPKKSIAVLPFENLSRDPDNAYFATGIQDEILTRLAKISALKVISRISTQQYAARPGNLSEIARQLGVTNILEGSVQKAADQVHINAQLIRAATGEHLWAESYDRKLDKIFDVEREVATAVAEALKTRLTSAEQQALAEKPTNNPSAYEAYLRGLAYALRPGYGERDTLAAVEHFSAAVKLDPDFALAWAWLARVSAQGYFNSAGRDVAALRETAKRAVTKLTQLQTNLGETSLAEGYFHYYCEGNYDAAIASFEKARQLAPKASEALQALALVTRRKGEWQRSLEYFRQAIELDPRNISLLSSNAQVCSELREYSLALKIYDRILEITPDDAEAIVNKAEIYQSQGNLSQAAALLVHVPSDPTSEMFPTQVKQKIFERRFADAIAMVNNVLGRRDPSLRDWEKAYYWSTLADLQQFSGDTAAAQITWQRVKNEIESLPRTQGTEVVVYAVAAAYAALGDKAKAIAIVDEQAAQEANDPLRAALFAEIKGRIAVYAGDKNSAIEQLSVGARIPGTSITYGDLKFDPIWDSLRGDPRFEKIVASLAPK